MDGWMDGWIDGWMDGWMSEWIDGWMDKTYICNLLLYATLLKTLILLKTLYLGVVSLILPSSASSSGSSVCFTPIIVSMNLEVSPMGIQERHLYQFTRL